MPRLLVSVRNAAEAALAIRAGAHLIDVKEPQRGPLGRPDRQVVEEVVTAVRGAAPVSMALGELADVGQLLAVEIPQGVGYAKLGMAGMAPRSDWQQRWQGVLASLPQGVSSVAVVYADWQSAASPSPGEMLDAAIPLGCRAVLVDTFGKSTGSLLDHWPLELLGEFVRSVRQAGLLMVLAGSLTPERVHDVSRLGPDYVAVRGAVCRGGREGALEGPRVERLVSLLCTLAESPCERNT
jgi:(5-formylfuran-3-yl)methyl phosphate synthase